MSKNALKQENKMLKELSADLRIKLVLLSQRPATTATPTVSYRYFCEHDKGKDGLTKGEKQQQKLEEKLKILHKVIKNLRENMTQIVDMDGWCRAVRMEDGDELVGCMYCAGPPVTWEEIVKNDGFPHVDNDKNEGTCPWRLMEKRAIKEYERIS